MFLVSPPLLYAFLAWPRCGRRAHTSGSGSGGPAPASGSASEPQSLALRRGFVIALLAGTLPMLVALMLFFATGYYQFGNRYLLDVMPLLLLLVASGMDGRVTRTASVLVALAIIANLFGAYRFCVG
jgi:hypothetical protein